jgi:hypothetical protein
MGSLWCIDTSKTNMQRPCFGEVFARLRNKSKPSPTEKSSTRSMEESKIISVTHADCFAEEGLMVCYGGGWK